MATIVEVNGVKHRKNCVCRHCKSVRRKEMTRAKFANADSVVVSIDGKRQEHYETSEATRTIGAMEQSVIDECKTLSAATERVSAVSLARKMARILDDDESIAMWPTASRQLSHTMDSLRGNSKKAVRGRLAQVQKMVQPVGTKTG
jgi:hypothetical protein